MAPPDPRTRTPCRTSSSRRDVTVRYPTPTFAVGQAVINTARCVGTPAGETEQELATDTFAGTLKPPGSITAASKRATTTALGPGQSDRFTVSGSNPNAEPLTGFEILDNLPAALTMVADGQPNVTGGGTPPVLAWRPEGGAFQPLATAVSGGGWQATAPAATDELRASYGTAASGFSASFVVRAGIPASGLGRDGNPVEPLSVIANCARVSATNATPRFACTARPQRPSSSTFTKALASAAQVLPGDTVSWDMALGVAAASAADLVDPVVTDCLPAGLDLVDTANPASSANGSAPDGLPGTGHHPRHLRCRPGAGHVGVDRTRLVHRPCSRAARSGSVTRVAAGSRTADAVKRRDADRPPTSPTLGSSVTTSR